MVKKKRGRNIPITHRLSPQPSREPDGPYRGIGKIMRIIVSLSSEIY
jgi:hypothetical protein